VGFQKAARGGSSDDASVVIAFGHGKPLGLVWHELAAAAENKDRADDGRNGRCDAM
jgi:hypothetical protein